MGSKKTRLSPAVVACLLEAASSDEVVNMTDLMEELDLSEVAIKQVLLVLVADGYLSIETDGVLSTGYDITDEGQEFLRAHRLQLKAPHLRVVET